MMNLVKWLGSCAMLWLVYRAIDWHSMLPLMKAANLWWLLLAFVLFHISQLLASFRFNAYLSGDNVSMNPRDAVAFNYVGTTLNLALPSGIGGDGYKGIILVKRLKMNTKRVVEISLSNRLSGLSWLVFWAIALIPFSSKIPAFISNFIPAILAGNLTLLLHGVWCMGFLLYSLLAHKILHENWKTQRITGFISCALQASILLCAWAILRALGIPDLNAGADYIIIFMIACVLAVLPISIGGLGMRELTLLKASQWLGLEHNTGVALASLFFIIYTTAAPIGVAAFLHLKRGILKHGEDKQ
jgi:uncharacterized membrane protein YbhN (UPF0104 family)